MIEPILAVDPGLSGAIALYWPSHVMLLVYDTPTMGTAKKKRINVTGLIDLLEPRIPAAAFVEDVHAMIGWGSGSIFRFGESKGAVLGVIGAMRIPVHLISPQVWKKSFGLSSDKEMARLRAIELFPRHAKLFARKADHNRAEAALIALYGAQFLKTKGVT